MLSRNNLNLPRQFFPFDVFLIQLRTERRSLSLADGSFLPYCGRNRYGPYECSQAQYSYYSQVLQPFYDAFSQARRSEEHTSELQSRFHLICRLLLEKKNYQE